jgi:hypothetical protein
MSDDRDVQTRDEAVRIFVSRIIHYHLLGINYTLTREFRKPIDYKEQPSDDRIEFEKDVWLKYLELKNKGFDSDEVKKYTYGVCYTPARCLV